MESDQLSWMTSRDKDELGELSWVEPGPRGGVESEIVEGEDLQITLQ